MSSHEFTLLVIGIAIGFSIRGIIPNEEEITMLLRSKLCDECRVRPAHALDGLCDLCREYFDRPDNFLTLLHRGISGFVRLPL